MRPAGPQEGTEALRLSAVRRYEVLDSPPEKEFDDLVALAAEIFGVPIALITLLDETRQWFKGRVGLDVPETSRAFAFCDHAIRGADVFEVHDARQDARFAANPLVTGDPHIRFYAGAPLTTADGQRLGTLCVIDRQPRALTATQRHTLAGLAQLVMRQLDLRREARQQALDAALHRALLESAPVAAIVTDPQFVITRLNPAAERLFGWRSAEVAGLHTPQIFHEPAELQQRADALSARLGRPLAIGAELFAAAMASGEPHRQDWTFVRRNGTHVPVHLNVAAVRDVDSHVLGYLGLVDDVTERVAALEEVQRSEARFRALSVSAPIGIFQTDPSGRCLYTNERWQELAGLTAAASLGDGWSEAIMPDDRDEILAAWSESARTGAEFSREFRMRGQGTPRWVHSRARAIRAETGEVIGYVGTVEDVTDRHAAEDATQSALREKDVLLREIHHRVKNNLQIISSLLRLHGKRVREAADVALFAEARERLRSMMLVHELLYQSNDLSRIDLADYLARLLRDLTPVVQADRPGPTIRLDCRPLDLHPDLALPLGMLVTELVTNALKYAYPAGQPGIVTVHAHVQTDRLIVTISDEGVGTPGDVDLERPPSFGWQLIRLLASQLNADVSRRPSSGTSIQITLPLARISASAHT